MLEKLKKRWNIKDNYEVVIILIVFSITGSATVVLKRWVFELIQITPETHLLIKISAYILVVLAIYNILLLAVGFIFGQFKFFWEFEKRFFSKLLFRKKSIQVKENVD